MIPDAEIAEFRGLPGVRDLDQTGPRNTQFINEACFAIERLLAERELLVAVVDALGRDETGIQMSNRVLDAWFAARRFE